MKHKKFEMRSFETNKNPVTDSASPLISLK